VVGGAGVVGVVPVAVALLGAVVVLVVVVPVDVVVVVVVVVPVDVVVVVVVVVVPVPVSVVVVVVVTPGEDGHDSDTDLTPGGRFREAPGVPGWSGRLIVCPFGRVSEDTGAPDGSWKDRVWPSWSTTVRVQSAAAALFGIAAKPVIARALAAARSRTFSFRRLNKVAPYPPVTSPGSDHLRQGTDPRQSTVSRARAPRY
jgi:hypothetical protein